MRSLLLALQFLSAVPVRVRGDVSAGDVARSAASFPTVGLLFGCVLVALDHVCGMVFHRDVVFALVVLVYTLLSGAFHLDGLADTADALAKKGGREDKLRVMKEGATGPAGVLAICSSLALKYLLLRNISHMPYVAYYSALIVMPAAARWAMLVSMFRAVPARDEGLGRLFLRSIRGRDLAGGTLSTALFMTLPVFFIPGASGLAPHLRNLGTLMVLFVLARAAKGFFERRFGGLTGDTVGAAGEMADVGYLMMVVAWQRVSF